MKHILAFVLSAYLLSACGDVVTEPTPAAAVAANPALANYIAVGSSWTAGYMNAGLYRNAQLVAYPNLLAQQFKTIGGGPFVEPLFEIGQENGTGYLNTPNTKITTNTAYQSSNSKLLNKYSGSSNNNWGIPNLRMTDVTRVGLGNPNNALMNIFYARLVPAGQEDKTYLRSIIDSKPTFFTLSIGDEDVQAFATSGGTDYLTDVLTFSSNYQSLLNALTANGAKGVVANVPDILSYPYFTYFTYAQFRANNGNADIYISTGNGLVRKAVSTDLFSFSAANTIGVANSSGQKKGLSAAYPMANNEVLDATEIANVNYKVQEINQVIKKEADARNLPIVDLNSIFKQINAGNYTPYGSPKVTFGYPSGGFFSLDGIHPTAKGYAIIANEFISVINSSYKNVVNTTVPYVDVSKFGAN